MYELRFARLREGAVLPTKRDEDSDYDLYACFDEEEFVIPAFSTRLIPTGLVSAFDKNLGVKFEERGSNTKWCGIVQAGVIDSGYRGEWVCAMYNGNPVPGTFSITGDGLDQPGLDCNGQTFSFTVIFTPESSNAFENVSWSSTITVINNLVVE